MKGRREGDTLSISPPHQFVLDRLREEDKWPVLLQAVAEVAGKKIEVRLSVSGGKKSFERGAGWQESRARLAKRQEELAEKPVEASAGGGMVTVVANGRQEILSVRIEKEVVSPDDVDLLQDLVRGAANSALSRSRAMVGAGVGEITGGMN